MKFIKKNWIALSIGASVILGFVVGQNYEHKQILGGYEIIHIDELSTIYYLDDEELDVYYNTKSKKFTFEVK